MSYSNNWGIDEVTEITSLKDCYHISNPNIKTKSILNEVGCPRLAIIDDWDGKGDIDTNTSIYKFDESQSPFVSYGDLQFYAIPNFLVNDKYISAYGLIKGKNGDDDSFKWKTDIVYSNNNTKNEKEKWNYNYAPIVLFDNLTTTYNYLKHYDINTDNDSIYGIIGYNKNTRTELPSIKIVPTNILKYIYSVTEKDLHITKNTTNISTYSFVNGSVGGDGGYQYYVDYSSGSGFSPKYPQLTYTPKTIRGDLVRIEYIYTLNPTKIDESVDDDTLEYEQKWPVLDENKPNELNNDILNSILFSDMKREIYGTGKLRPDGENIRVDFDSPARAYLRHENNFSWNYFSSIPQGLNNINFLDGGDSCHFSSPMMWKNKDDGAIGGSTYILFNLNPNETISTGYEQNSDYLLSYIIGQSVFLNVPKYEWLFSSTKSLDDEKEHFVSNDDYYFKSDTVNGNDKNKIKAHSWKNRYISGTTTLRPQSGGNYSSTTLYFDYNTGPNYIANEGGSVVHFSSSLETNSWYKLGTLSAVNTEFPFKGNKNATIKTSDYVGNTIGADSWLKKKIEEKIAGEMVTVKELNWFGKPYYILDEDGKDVTHTAEGGTEVNHCHGVHCHQGNREYGIYLTSAIKDINTHQFKDYAYGLSVNFDFTLSSSSSSRHRNAVVGLTTEPIWFEYNYNNCTYNIKSYISDYQNLLPVTASFKFYVYNEDTGSYEWSEKKDIEINNEVQTIEIDNNNRLIVTGDTDMPIWEDVSGQVSFEEVGSSIRIDYDDYSHAKYFKIGNKYPLPDGIKGIKDSTNFEATGINTERGILIYNKIDEDVDYRRDWDLYAKIIDDKLVLYGRDSGDDGGYSWDDEWEDFEIGLDIQKLLFYVKGVIDWEVKTTQNNTEVWKRTGFETGYVSLLLCETKVQSDDDHQIIDGIVRCEDVGTKVVNGVTYKAEKLISSILMPPRVWGIHYQNFASIFETNFSFDDLRPGDNPRKLPNSGMWNSTYVYIDPDTDETFLLDETGRGITIYGWRTYKIQS